MNILSLQYFSTHARCIQVPLLLQNRSLAINRPIISNIPLQHLPVFAGRYEDVVLNQVCYSFRPLLNCGAKAPSVPFEAWLPSNIDFFGSFCKSFCMKNEWRSKTLGRGKVGWKINSVKNKFGRDSTTPWVKTSPTKGEKVAARGPCTFTKWPINPTALLEGLNVLRAQM